MKMNHLFVGVVLLFIYHSANAAKLEALLHVGLDTNPHDLSDTSGTVQQEFAQAGIYSKSSYNDWLLWDINVEKTLYFNDDRADRFAGELAIAVQSNFNLLELPFNYALGAGVERNDETYIAKETGLVATYDNNSIADRFDSDSRFYQFSLSHPFSERAYIEVNYQNKDVSFQQYALDGLDNLDHKESSVGTKLGFKPQASAEYYIGFTHHLRDYKAREDRDEQGELIDGSQLSFNRYQTHLGYIFHTEQGTEWDFQFFYVNRSSSGTQYYDAQRSGISVSTDIQLADYHYLNAMLNYESFVFDESLQQPFEYLDQNDVEQQGGRIALEYRWLIASLFKTSLGLYAKVEFKQFTSPNDFYEFQRQQASVGFVWKLN
ncbi:hypothetical protein ACUR5C_07575 [Aliikangiella sp. IMCC44653]